MTRASVKLHNALARAWAESPDRTVAVVVALALLVRLAWVLVGHRDAAIGDPAAYTWYGNRLSCGHGYDSHPAFLERVARLDAEGRLPDQVSACDAGKPLPPSAFYAIGYPLFLALLFAPARGLGVDASDQDLVYGVAHALLGAATVYLVARIARRLFSPRVGIVAAIVMAFWPNLVIMTATAHLETLYLFLVVAAVLTLLPLLEAAMPVSASRLIAGGAILGVAAEVRPLVALIVPGLLLAFRYKPESWGIALRHTAIVTVTMLAFLAPWTLRNTIEMPGFVLATTGTGDALCISRHEHATGRFELNSPGCLHSLPGAEWDELEIEKNAQNTSRAIKWTIEHPISELKLWFWRGYYAFRDDHEARLALESPVSQPLWSDRGREVADTVADLWYWGVLGLAAIGLPTFVRDRRGGTRLVLGAAAAALVVPFLLFGDPRYKVPGLPFVAIIAAVGVERVQHGRVIPAPAKPLDPKERSA